VVASMDGSARPGRTVRGMGNTVTRMPQDRAEGRSREQQRADEQERDAENGRPGRAERDADGAAEQLADVAALVAAERDHQAAGDDDETCPERPDVDEFAPGDHERAERDKRDGHDPRRAADQCVEAVDERAADVAAVPAEVEDAREEDPEREERKAPELRVPVAPRLLGRALLDPARRLGTQTRPTLLARHD